MEISNTKPVVSITDILVNQSGVQYFAEPEDLESLPQKALWVALGDTEKCWIEVFPISFTNLEGIDDFSEGYEVFVDSDNSFLPPGTPPYPGVLSCRWFAILTE